MLVVGRRRAVSACRIVANTANRLRRSPCLGVGEVPIRQFAAVCAEALRTLESGIAHGVHGRLAGLSAGLTASPKPPIVAVAGRHSIEFVAAVRAARSVGATVVPMDVQGHDREELCGHIAEARAVLVVTAGLRAQEEVTALRTASMGLGAQIASVASLHAEGHAACEASAAAIGEASSSAAWPSSVMFFSGRRPDLSGCSSPTPLRVAEVAGDAFDARVRRSLALWGFTKQDQVLSLGLRSDAPAAIVDAVEAPLMAGAAVHIASPSSVSSAERVWDHWAAIHQNTEATVAFSDVTLCWKLVDAYSQLAAPLRAELDSRWAAKPLRHTIAVVGKGGVSLSRELAKRWAEVFGSPLVWLFTCAEAGSLYTVTTSIQRETPFVGKAAEGLEWRLGERDELMVRGEGVFAGYFGRPRSSAEAFGGDVISGDEGLGAGFCRTGHRVDRHAAATGTLLPDLALHDLALESRSNAHLTKGPGVLELPMKPDWRVKKIPIRKYYYWKSKKGYRVYTKKHNNVNMVYDPGRGKKK